MRARITDDPDIYRWSSCAANLGQRQHSGLTPHRTWQSLGRSRHERDTAYRALLDKVLEDDALAEIRIHLQQRAPGDDAIRVIVEAKTRRFSSVRPVHRPKSRDLHPEK